MKKRILFTASGFVTILLTIVLFYLFLTSLNDGGNLFYFAGALISLVVMVFSFVKANKPIPVAPYVPQVDPGDEKKGGILEANNDMIKEYNKTEKAKERLRMLELAGSANNE